MHESDIVIWARILTSSGDYNRERRRQEREMIRGREFARNAMIERGGKREEEEDLDERSCERYNKVKEEKRTSREKETIVGGR